MRNYDPGIFVPEGYTLTINGGGALETSSNFGAGIGEILVLGNRTGIVIVIINGKTYKINY